MLIKGIIFILGVVVGIACVVALLAFYPNIEVKTHEYWGLIGSILGTSIAVLLVILQLRDKAKYDRKKNTIDFLDKHFHSSSFIGNQRIIDEFIAPSKQSHEKEEVDSAALELLNLYEDLAIRVRHGILDITIIKDTLGVNFWTKSLFPSLWAYWMNSISVGGLLIEENNVHIAEGLTYYKPLECEAIFELALLLNPTLKENDDYKKYKQRAEDLRTGKLKYIG